jgi:hypothetical protein
MLLLLEDYGVSKNTLWETPGDRAILYYPEQLGWFNKNRPFVILTFVDLLTGNEVQIPEAQIVNLIHSGGVLL